MINETQFFKSMFFIGAPIIILALISFFIGIGFFIANYNVNYKNKNTPHVTKDIKIVTKKDMAYWFIILVIFIIFWLSSYLYNDSKLVDYISFSGTIVSIILAIVAIIFSYFQNFTSSNTAEKLLETSDSLVSSLSSLDEYNNNICKYENDISNIIKTLNVLTNYMEDSAYKLNKLDTSVEFVKKTVSTDVDKSNHWSSKVKLYDELLNPQDFDKSNAKHFTFKTFSKNVNLGDFIANNNTDIGDE